MSVLDALQSLQQCLRCSTVTVTVSEMLYSHRRSVGDTLQWTVSVEDALQSTECGKYPTVNQLIVEDALRSTVEC